MRAFHPSQQCVRCRRCFAQYDAALSAAIVLGKVMDAVDGMHVYFAEGIKQCTLRDHALIEQHLAYISVAVSHRHLADGRAGGDSAELGPALAYCGVWARALSSSVAACAAV